MIPTFNTLLAYKPLDNVVPVYTPVILLVKSTPSNITLDVLPLSNVVKTGNCVILIVDIHYPNKIKYPFSVFIELPF
jgi:hypothetical protein